MTTSYGPTDLKRQYIRLNTTIWTNNYRRFDDYVINGIDRRSKRRPLITRRAPLGAVRGDVITPTYHHERREARRDRQILPGVAGRCRCVAP
jgi:hypothetical protein